ncbi:hypothetical protein ACIXNN_12470 [Bacteroides fragilis]
MALSEELPLYRDTYRLLNNLLILTQDFRASSATVWAAVWWI